MRVAVAMSGGVDSLRTAILLKELGEDVFGIHMRLLPSSRNGRWCAESTIRDREETLADLAARVGIPLTVVEMREAFEAEVIQPFLTAYRQGLTPNPCIVCNPRIKFGLLRREAERLGAERIATGHYARIAAPDGASDRYRLYRAKDPAKDQSYFLYGLTQEQLASTLFPLGDSSKREVLEWAQASGFGSELSEESQEICFIPSGNYQEFLIERLGLAAPEAPRPIVDQEGTLLGEHKGLFAYTVGQRRGLGIASTAPYYVVALEPATNTVRVGRERDLYCTEFKADTVNWVSIPAPEAEVSCRIRIRNQHRPAPARVIPVADREVLVRFEQPQRAVTPGQAAVFYDGDLVLGGGTITREKNSADT